MSWRLFNSSARVATIIIALVGLIYMIIPILTIVPISFSADRYISLPVSGYSLKWYERMWNSVGYRGAFANTLLIGVAVAALSAVLGTMAALAVVRGKLPFARLVSVIVLSPLVMPQIILAIGIFPIIAQFGLIGSKFAVIIAHTAISISLVFITVSSALRGYSQNMELAAMTLGANGLRTFLHVTWPNIWLGVLVGAIFSFALSFDEIIIALFLTDASSVTLPVYMWNEIRFAMDPTITAASIVAIAISLSMLSIVGLLQSVGKKAR